MECDQAVGGGGGKGASDARFALLGSLFG